VTVTRGADVVSPTTTDLFRASTAALWCWSRHGARADIVDPAVSWVRTSEGALSRLVSLLFFFYSFPFSAFVRHGRRLGKMDFLLSSVFCICQGRWM
jgi:hypothetical protein